MSRFMMKKWKKQLQSKSQEKRLKVLIVFKRSLKVIGCLKAQYKPMVWLLESVCKLIHLVEGKGTFFLNSSLFGPRRE